MTDLKMIALKDIRPDENQPRKYYDEVAMHELTESVKEKGVLQNILIRPTGKGYKLVYGERRYRAAIAAGLTEIPARIQEMTDEEALELQIIENLQRKDVNPMEEGAAFKMLQSRFSIEEIAHRVGKTPAYVAQRMKLCDLTKEWQDLLFADRLKLGLAFKIARLPEKAQREIYKEARVPKDWAKKKEWELPSWVDADQHEHELDKAPFKTEDANLYPEAGACNNCQYNSHFNKLLFPDLQRKRVCHNGVCFEIKAAKAYAQTIAKAAENPEMLFVVTSSYLDADSKRKVKAAEELGVKVLDSDMIEDAAEPEAPASWEEFLEEQKSDYGWDEMNAKEQKSAMKDWKEEYADEKQQYESELKDWKDQEAAGLLCDAFVVAGYNHVGSVIKVRIKGKKGIAKENAAAGDNVALIAIESEIAELKDREKRNKELDREKVFKRLAELFKADDNAFETNVAELSPDEWAAVLYTMAEGSMRVRDMLQEEFSMSFSYHGIELWQAITQNQSNQVLHRAFRMFIKDRLLNMNELDYEKRGKAAAMYAIGKQYYDVELQTYEIEQQERAEKRGANVKKRLDALQAKKKELQPGSKPEKKTGAKKSSKK